MRTDEHLGATLDYADELAAMRKSLDDAFDNVLCHPHDYLIRVVWVCARCGVAHEVDVTQSSRKVVGNVRRISARVRHAFSPNAHRTKSADSTKLSLGAA